MKTILVTCGDNDGIGFEIASKALAKVRIPDKHRIVIFRPRKNKKNWAALYEKKYHTVQVNSFDDLQDILHSRENAKVIQFTSGDTPVDWVEMAARLCKENRNFSLVNAPLSKTLVAETGRRDKGHTDIYKRLCGRKNLHMAFVGKHFSTILATDHIPISKVETQLGQIDILDSIASYRGLIKSSRSCAILGLNPHASERGLIGDFEKVFLKKDFQQRMRKLSAYGPFPADSFFAHRTWERYPLVLAMYHDQGLIPFKMWHQKSPSVHLTLGLPFIRTSVDHGTAKDIAGKGIADASSMLEAIKLNLKLVNQEE